MNRCRSAFNVLMCCVTASYTTTSELTYNVLGGVLTLHTY